LTGILSRVNWIDIFALILLIKITYASLRIGVGKQILPGVLLLLIVLATFYGYNRMAIFLVNKFSFSASLAKFICYLFLLIICSILYRVIGRISKIFFSSEESETLGIEKAGGVILGIFRTTLILGLIFTCIMLAPFEFTEKAVTESLSGPMVIEINLNIYCSVMNLFAGTEYKKVSYGSVLSNILSGKKQAIKIFDIKKRSKFFKSNY